MSPTKKHNSKYDGNKEPETQHKFKNKSVMVTDLMKRTDALSIELLEYFEKNFDAKLSVVKRKYDKANE